MVQPFFSRSTLGNAFVAGPRYATIPSTSAAGQLVGGQTYEDLMMPIGGTFRRVGMMASSSGATVTLTLQKNGSDTAIVLSHSGALGVDEDLSNEVHYDAGDIVRFKWEFSGSGGGTPNAFIRSVFMEWVPDDGVSCFHRTPGMSGQFAGILDPWYATVFSHYGDGNQSAAQVEEIVSAPGTITDLTAILIGIQDGGAQNGQAATAGASYDLTLVVNGVDAFSFTLASATSAVGVVNTTLNVHLDAGDLIYWRRDYNSGQGRPISIGVALVPDTPLHSNIVTSAENYINSAARVKNFHSEININANDSFSYTRWSTANRYRVVAAQCLWRTAPTAGKSWNVAFAHGQPAVASALSMTVADAATTGSTTGSVDVAQGDEFGVIVTPTNTPALAGGNNDCLIAFTLEEIPPLLVVTQLVVQVFTNEDADEDIPDEAAPCSGGGTMPSGTNPAAGTSLASAVSPQFWLEIDVAGSAPTTIRIGKGPLPDSDSYKEPRVLSFGTVERALADAQGRVETARLEVVVADVDRLVRGYMDQLWSGEADADPLIDQPARLYGRDSAGAGTAQLLFHGTIREVRTGANDLTATLVIEDLLSGLVTSTFADRALMPPALITSDISDASSTEEMIDKPIPLAYGSLSDETAGDDAVGVVPARYVKTEASRDYFLICLGAVKNIQSVFGADYLSAVLEPTARIKFADSAWGAWAWAPTMPGWVDINADPWYEVNGRRYTMLILDHEHVVSRLARDGRIQISVNLCGYEDVGDGSGTLIDSIERQLLHFLVNFVFNRYDGTGNWATTIPELGGYSAIDTASFEATKAAGEAMFSGGILGAALIGHDLRQVAAFDVVAQFCRSGAMEVGTNRVGQVMLTRLDRSVNGDAAAARTDLAHIIRNSFRLIPARDELVDIVPYRYARNYLPALAELAPDMGARLPQDPYRGAWISGLLTVDDGTDGTRRAEVQDYEMLRDLATAAWVARQCCDLRSVARLVAEWRERLGGTDHELGSLAALTNYKGTGTAGWSGRLTQVRRHELQVDLRTVRVTARDVQDLLQTPMLFEGDTITFGGDRIVT